MLEPAAASVNARPAALVDAGFRGGRVVGEAFRLFGSHVFGFSLVAVVFLSPSILLDLAVGETDGYSRLSISVWNLLGCFATAGVVRGTLDALDGLPVHVSAMFRAGASSGFRVVGVSIIVGIITVLGLILVVIPALIAIAGLYVASAVVVAEPGITARNAVERSWSLTRGHRWATLGITTLFTAIPFAVALVFAAVATQLRGGVGAARALEVLGSIVIAASTGLSAAATAIAFRELRTEKEGVAQSDLVAVFE
jgi:hypothetical protein